MKRKVGTLIEEEVIKRAKRRAIESVRFLHGPGRQTAEAKILGEMEKPLAS
jgi:hypothetical protein